MYRCFPLHLLTPSSLRGVCNPLSVLFVFRRLFRLLLLSATHLYSVNPFHCENVVLQFTFPLLLPLFLLILPSLFLSIFSVFFVIFFSLFSFFLCIVQGRSTFSFFFSPFLYISETSRSRFLFYHSIPDRASPVARSFSKSDCSTSDYLTLLINSRYKSLRFSLFHGTRPPLEARKIK